MANVIVAVFETPATSFCQPVCFSVTFASFSMCSDRERQSACVAAFNLQTQRKRGQRLSTSDANIKLANAAQTSGGDGIKKKNVPVYSRL